MSDYPDFPTDGSDAEEPAAVVLPDAERPIDDDEADTGLVPDAERRVEAAGIDPDFATTQEEETPVEEAPGAEDDEITPDELP